MRVEMTDSVAFRKKAMSKIPDTPGVYVLCDLDASPVYVGQSKDGIRRRVSRHLTSARSDIVANKMIDIWEVAYVWSYQSDGDLNTLESFLFHHFNDAGDVTLFNGSVPSRVKFWSDSAPAPHITQVLPEDEIRWRQKLHNRIPRQTHQFGSLLDVFVGVKSEAHIARALNGHFTRLKLYHDMLQGRLL